MRGRSIPKSALRLPKWSGKTKVLYGPIVQFLEIQSTKLVLTWFTRPSERPWTWRPAVSMNEIRHFALWGYHSGLSWGSAIPELCDCFQDRAVSETKALGSFETSVLLTHWHGVTSLDVILFGMELPRNCTCEKQADRHRLCTAYSLEPRPSLGISLPKPQLHPADTAGLQMHFGDNSLSANIWRCFDMKNKAC